MDSGLGDRMEYICCTNCEVKLHYPRSGKDVTLTLAVLRVLSLCSANLPASLRRLDPVASHSCPFSAMPRSNGIVFFVTCLNLPDPMGNNQIISNLGTT